MNCQDFEKIVIPLTHKQLMDAATREQGLTHTRVCVRCARRLLEEQTLLAGVRAVVAEIVNQEAPARLETALLAAFREHTAVAVSPVVIQMPVKSKPWSRGKLAALIAASILLLLSGAAMLSVQSNALQKQREKQADSAKPSSAPESIAPSFAPKERAIDHELAPRPATANLQKHARHQVSKSRLSEGEVVTEFFPLLEGDDLSSIESGQIVRVELSESALLAVGLPVDAAMLSETVKADVVLGHDGQARAIRFVR